MPHRPFLPKWNQRDGLPEVSAQSVLIVGLGRFGTALGTTLMELGKADIARRGIELGVDFGLTHTCYDPRGTTSCGRCDACRLRLAGFAEAGISDPLPYVTRG